MDEKQPILIRRLRVANFGCVRDATVDFEPLTVLVGPNDSGKSMLFRALATLREAGSMGPGGPTEQGWASLFPSAAAIAAQTFNGAGDQIELELAGQVGGVSYDYTTTIRFAQGVATSSEHLRYGDADIAKLPPDSTKYHRASDTTEGSTACGPFALPIFHPMWLGSIPANEALDAILASARPLLGGVRSIRLHALRPEILRWPNMIAAVGEKPNLGVAGDGLAYAIANLLLSGRDVLDRVEKALAQAMPHVKRIDIKHRTHNDLPVYELELVTRAGARVPSHAISDGVLLFLGYLYLVLGPDPVSVLLVEEPETGLHPGLLRRLVQLFRDMTTGAHGGPPTQVIMTTHSPMLLNLVEPGEIRVVQRGDDGATTVTPFSNAPDLDALLEYQGPGEIWVNEGESYLVGGESKG